MNKNSIDEKTSIFLILNLSTTDQIYNKLVKELEFLLTRLVLC